MGGHNPHRLRIRIKHDFDIALLQKVREEFEIGNLYINRGITGAMVDRHPFGGFKTSGFGSKTGDPDYLKQFTEAASKPCSEENKGGREARPCFALHVFSLVPTTRT